MTGETSCFWYVTWDLAQGIYSTGRTVSFYTPNTSGFFSWSGEPATVHALPRLGASSFKQYTDPMTGQQQYFTVVEGSSNSMTVKYDSRIGWHRLTRKGGYVTLKASVAEFSRSAAIYAGGYVAWSNAKVRFQYKTATGWVTAKTVLANSSGTATARLKRGTHTWRAISVNTATVWGKATHGHRG